MAALMARLSCIPQRRDISSPWCSLLFSPPISLLFLTIMAASGDFFYHRAISFATLRYQFGGTRLFTLTWHSSANDLARRQLALAPMHPHVGFRQLSLRLSKSFLFCLLFIQSSLLSSLFSLHYFSMLPRTQRPANRAGVLLVPGTPPGELELVLPVATPPHDVRIAPKT